MTDLVSNTQCTLCTPRTRNAGFSLVELLVCVVIGLVVTLAVASMMTISEDFNRGTIATNDTNQTGAHSAFLLDRSIRNAGSGFMQSWSSDSGNALGCLLNASRDNTPLLPLASALPAPFQDVPLGVRLAPVVIVPGTDSDVLIVMSGAGGFAETGRPVVSGSVTGNSVDLVNTLGFRGGDVFLLSANGAGCMLQQVQAGYAGSSLQRLNMGGRYFSATGSTTSLTAFASAEPFVVGLGNISADVATHNPPQFHLFGIGDNDTLVTHDLLTDDATTLTPLAEGVVQIRALYGVDTNGDGTRDGWRTPTGNYSAATLLNGSSGSQALLRTIVAVRLAIVLRTSLPERGEVSPAELTLFRDMDESFHQTFTTNRNLRYRLIETTVPLPNVLML